MRERGVIGRDPLELGATLLVSDSPAPAAGGARRDAAASTALSAGSSQAPRAAHARTV
jgi:hypothetical protein